MAQQGKKTLNMFRNLRNKLVEEAKKSGEPAVPNLKGALVDVRAPSGEKKEGCGAYPERGRKWDEETQSWASRPRLFCWK